MQYLTNRILKPLPGVAGICSLTLLFICRRGLKIHGIIRLIISLFIIIQTSALYAVTDEQKLYSRIKSIPLADRKTFESESSLFLKKYPRSILVPDIKFLQAERQKDIDLAIDMFSSIVKNYPDFHRRAEALYRECQILDLKSRWKELEARSSRGIKLFPAGKYAPEFRLMRATALLMLERFDECREECIRVTENSHDLEVLSRAMFLLAEAEKKITGNSKSYISGLRELVLAYRDSEIFPSILYRLGMYYDDKKDGDKAWSAYSDLIKKYPDSPEADLAIARIELLKKEKPSYVKYLPDQKTVDEADSIDIQPEYETRTVDSPVYYSVAIGPFTKRKETEKIIRLLGSYDDSRVTKTGSGYTVFIGKYADSDEALAARIRLAEEYGINGEIVRFSEKKSKSYIYGD